MVDEAPNDSRNLNRVTEKKPTIEIENLAEIIEDFKMVTCGNFFSCVFLFTSWHDT